MADGQISNYKNNNHNINSYYNQYGYYIIYPSQIMDATIAKNNITNYINPVRNKINAFINSCNEAKSNCDTTKFSGYSNGVQVNTFPTEFDKLISFTSDLLNDINSLEETLHNLADTYAAQDTRAYNTYKAAQEYASGDNNKGGTAV